MSNSEWTWELIPTAQNDLAALDTHEQTVFSTNLTKWLIPRGAIHHDGEPLQNSPRKKVRVGEFRLAVTFRQNEQRMVVARIKRRGGAYTADDD